MSWKTEATAAIVSTVPAVIAAAPAPQAEHPMALAIADLRAAGRAFASRYADRGDEFARRSGEAAYDIAAKLERFGSFVSDAQAGYARKLCDWSGIYQTQQEARGEAQAQPATPVAAPPVTPALSAVRVPQLAALVNLDKFARFTVGKLSLSLKNDGSVVWVKWDGTLAGIISQPGGEFRQLRRGLSDADSAAARAELLRVEADPMAAAKAHGILTGRCTCCGRPLTDPNSIAIGIGPICLANFA